MKPIRNTIGGIGNLMFKQAYLYAQWREGNIPDIYLQSERYFKKYEQEIKRMYGEGIGKIDMVSLQIRRGDYVDNPFYVDLTKTDYYQKAVSHFPDDRFLVFCHDNQDPEQDKKDKEWCKDFLDTFIPGRYEMNVPGEETEDLNRMASCTSNILANSSFGFWAAWLNPHPSKKVIVPSAASWFSDRMERVELLSDWIKISV